MASGIRRGPACCLLALSLCAAAGGGELRPPGSLLLKTLTLSWETPLSRPPLSLPPPRGPPPYTITVGVRAHLVNCGGPGTLRPEQRSLGRIVQRAAPGRACSGQPSASGRGPCCCLLRKRGPHAALLNPVCGGKDRVPHLTEGLLFIGEGHENVSV